MFGLESDDGDKIIKVNFKNKYIIVLIVNPVLQNILHWSLLNALNAFCFKAKLIVDIVQTYLLKWTYLEVNIIYGVKDASECYFELVALN